MFETAELGQRVPKNIFKERELALRRALIMTQQSLKRADFPVVLLFGGVDGAGKSETANLLNEWMDPRWIQTSAFGPPAPDELERPPHWRYWLALPPKGHLGILLSAWYTQPLLDRVHGGDDNAFDDALAEIRTLETMLADDGALVLKFWMHLGRKAQKKRFKKLEKDPLQSWRVTPTDWEHWKRYDDFIAAAERLISRTSTGQAPWHIVEGRDPRYRSLRVGEILLEALEKRLAHEPAPAHEGPTVAGGASELDLDVEAGPVRPRTVLSSLDLSKRLDEDAYGTELERLRGELNRLHRGVRDRGRSTLVVLEGWDAAGKGGAIRRVVSALDASWVRVHPFAAPSDEEAAHHHLWRFWRKLPRAGEMALFDRSWYGRVLVERVEGYAAEHAWRRAYAEINHFEQQVVAHGTVLVKFWVHIGPEEQLRRFRRREETPHKRWKLTEEDWRNRKRWPEYEQAVHDMVERTSTPEAPWTLVEGDDKRYARIRVMQTICDRVEASLGHGDG